MLPVISLDDVDFAGRRVFTRVDFNVPLSDGGKVEDEFRIRAALPTLRKIVGDGGRCIVASHLGRPKGTSVSGLSLRPVHRVLERLMKGEVWYAPGCVGPEVRALVTHMAPGSMILLENLRFHPGETSNDPQFAAELAQLADCFVNDAFGAAHRAHASNVGVSRHFNLRVPGYLMSREVDWLSRVLENPRKPLALVVGGRKLEGKIEVIRNLLDDLDLLMVGGAMAFTFLAARGIEVGRSLVGHERLLLAREILDEGSLRRVRLELPIDSLAVEPPPDGRQARIVGVDKFPHNMMGVDIGPKTRRRFADALKGCATVVWNGPMGIAEEPAYAKGTVAMARTLAKLTSQGTETVVCGGDVAAALRRTGFQDKISHVSTGGGAALELLAGKELPALRALEDS